ncbi:MAG TPA: DUF6496 domain-containing protein, partial [Acetobacteraceae bacterium]|nr:DUF6496 domain-containing protein [Acetobacteraceae bacterium]
MATHETPEQQATVRRVMHEFKHGELKGGRGGKVRPCGRNRCHAFLTGSRIGFCSNHCVTGMREPDMLTGMTERDWSLVL